MARLAVGAYDEFAICTPCKGDPLIPGEYTQASKVMVKLGRWWYQPQGAAALAHNGVWSEIIFEDGYAVSNFVD